MMAFMTLIGIMDFNFSPRVHGVAARSLSISHMMTTRNGWLHRATSFDDAKIAISMFCQGQVKSLIGLFQS